MKTYGEIKRSVLQLAQKNPAYQGYFTDDKIQDAVNEGFDYIAVDMFQAGEGWLREQRYLDWTANTRVVEIPSDVAIINAIRWKNGDVYYPLKYDAADSTLQSVKGEGTGEPQTFRIIQNKIFLNPEPSSFGTAKIELEFSRYPTRLVGELQTTMPDFDNAMMHWIKYYAANTLIGASGKTSPFRQNEVMWYEQMRKVVDLRNRVKRVVADFGD
jgi:hypothetical protein